MSNRRNMTRAQRVWREARRLSVADIMARPRTEIRNRRGEQIFFWRPSEISVEIRSIRTTPRRAIITADFAQAGVTRTGGDGEAGSVAKP